MQPLSWYLARLRAMSPAEVAWRVRTGLRDQLERVALPVAAGLITPRPTAAPQPGDLPLRLCPSAADARNGRWPAEWRQRLAARAERIAAGRLSFFDLHDQHLGDPVDWNRDHKSNRPAPLRFAPTIDYRDFATTGDCKFVWEPNRHHHLVVLARAYQATGEEKFAAAVADQIESWLAQCPYRRGMNWRSPLELAVRLINWVFALDLLRGSGALSGALWRRWLAAAELHLREIRRNYSRGSSAGNHLIGEAAGVFIGASYLSFLPAAEKWQRESRDILEAEISRQTFADGGPREQALGYHLFDLQFFLLAALVARRGGSGFSARYLERLGRMAAFVAALAAGGDELPMFGDCDDGYVLDLGHGRPGADELLALCAALLGRPGLMPARPTDLEGLHWLLRGDELPAWLDAAGRQPTGLRSQAFGESGWYLLQCGGGDDRISVVFDCGALGLPPLAGHGHADALSFTLRAFGRDVLVDPGTYDYFSYPGWRSYFRSTRAHNTIVIDNCDQSPMRGPFLWGRPAEARCLSWQPDAAGGTVVGEHDGYTRLAAPVVHRRTLRLDGRRRELLVRDELRGSGRHELLFCLHLAEHCRLTRRARNVYEIEVGCGTVELRLDPRLTVAALHGSLQPRAGWVSRGYHRKTPATTLLGRAEFDANQSLECRIAVSRPRGAQGESV